MRHERRTQKLNIVAANESFTATMGHSLGAYSLGAYCAGAYCLGAYSLGASSLISRMFDVVQLSSDAGLQSGGSQSPFTHLMGPMVWGATVSCPRDLGSRHALTTHSLGG